MTKPLEPSNLFQKCPETGETTKSLEYGKCLETGEMKKSLEFVKCQETGEMTKSLEYVKCPETGKRQSPFHQQKRHSRGAPTDLLDV